MLFPKKLKIIMFPFPKKLSVLVVLLFLWQLPITKSEKKNHLALSKKTGSGFVLLELFTSEGCSSCPPADKLMNDLEKEADKNGTEIYILNMHVNYWDYLGWKDVYAKSKFTDRQDYYARFFPSGRSYTPQLVINGKHELVGSEEALIKKHIAAEQTTKSDKIIKTLRTQRIDSTAVTLSYELLNLIPGTSLYFALIEKKTPESLVRVGENSGKRLSHYSVVRLLEKVEPKKLLGKFELKYPIKTSTKNFSIIAFLQQNEKRTIEDVISVAIR
jgi:hypothetical protein